MKPKKPESLTFVCPLAKGTVECVLLMKFYPFPPSLPLSLSPSLHNCLHTYIYLVYICEYLAYTMYSSRQ